MHMADALLSPAVGGGMWAASAATIACSSARVRAALDDRMVPLMGVLGAFIFAAQMINFSIPGTGSSGHIGGALLLAVLLGPSAAFLTVASVLVIQALFFADGGLLALGCNMFNLGFLPAFVVYPLFYQRLIGSAPSRNRFILVTTLSAVVSFQLGALAVVAETVCSGISALPFATFLLLMQPVHLAIGLVEGAVTVAVLSFLQQARPGMVPGAPVAMTSRKAVAALFIGALLTAGALSCIASKDPDGLEWAIAKVTGAPELKAPAQGVHRAMASLQAKSAWFPEYQVRHPVQGDLPGAGKAVHGSPAADSALAGVAGTLLTLLIVLGAGFFLKKRSQGAA